MKKLSSIVLILLLTTGLKAQIVASLAVSAQPPGAILSWTTKDLSYFISNPTQATRRAVIKSVLTLTDGTPVATTNLATARVYNINPGNIVLNATDVIPLESMIFVGKFKNSLDRSGKLPAGTYQLCVQLVTPIDFLALTEQRCRTFTLASFQLPIPVMPASGDVLEAEKAQTAITFRWTPVTPNPQAAVRYTVTVFEILDRQTPMQALRSNQPLLTKQITGTTQFIWQPQLSFIKTRIWDQDSAKAGDPADAVINKIARDSMDVTRFIWTIQTTDLNGIPFGDGNVNGDGISEPNTFFVIKDRRKNRTGPPAKIIYEQWRRNGGN